jgi:hypothetical protein
MVPSGWQVRLLHAYDFMILLPAARFLMLPRPPGALAARRFAAVMRPPLDFFMAMSLLSLMVSAD